MNFTGSEIECISAGTDSGHAGGSAREDVKKTKNAEDARARGSMAIEA